jgi:hypothetical protein
VIDDEAATASRSAAVLGAGTTLSYSERGVPTLMAQLRTSHVARTSVKPAMTVESDGNFMCRMGFSTSS